MTEEHTSLAKLFLLVSLLTSLVGCVELTVVDPYGDVDEAVHRQLEGVWKLQGSKDNSPDTISMRAAAGQLHVAATSWNEGSADSAARYTYEEFTVQICKVSGKHLIFIKPADKRRWSVARFELVTQNEFQVFLPKTAELIRLSDETDGLKINQVLDEASKLKAMEVEGNAKAFIKALSGDELMQCFPDANKLAVYRLMRTTPPKTNP